MNFHFHQTKHVEGKGDIVTMIKKEIIVGDNEVICEGHILIYRVIFERGKATSINVYVSSYSSGNKANMWSFLGEKVVSWDWIMIGDFNITLEEEDRFPTTKIHIGGRELEEWGRLVTKHNFIDMGRAKGVTWCNNKKGVDRREDRLNRAYNYERGVLMGAPRLFVHNEGSLVDKTLLFTLLLLTFNNMHNKREGNNFLKFNIFLLQNKDTIKVVKMIWSFYDKEWVNTFERCKEGIYLVASFFSF